MNLIPVLFLRDIPIARECMRLLVHRLNHVVVVVVVDFVQTAVGLSIEHYDTCSDENLRDCGRFATIRCIES